MEFSFKKCWRQNRISISLELLQGTKSYLLLGQKVLMIVKIYRIPLTKGCTLHNTVDYYSGVLNRIWSVNHSWIALCQCWSIEIHRAKVFIWPSDLYLWAVFTDPLWPVIEIRWEHLVIFIKPCEANPLLEKPYGITTGKIEKEYSSHAAGMKFVW